MTIPIATCPLHLAILPFCERRFSLYNEYCRCLPRIHFPFPFSQSPVHLGCISFLTQGCNAILHASDWFRNPGLSQSAQGTPVAIGIDPCDSVKATIVGRREGGRQTLNWGFRERRVPALRSKLPEMIFFLLLDIVRVKGKA